MLKTFRDLEKAGLLIRSTYLDVTNLNDVTLVIEKRLEIQLGTLDNMEYRSAFLAKVINEKISGTEHVIMDYRSEDIYVRQPEDGQARMIPKPSAAPEPTGSAAPGGTAAPSQSQPADWNCRNGQPDGKARILSPERPLDSLWPVCKPAEIRRQKAEK